MGEDLLACVLGGVYFTSSHNVGPDLEVGIGRMHIED
jgi:hypothetical protein